MNFATSKILFSYLFLLLGLCSAESLCASNPGGLGPPQKIDQDLKKWADNLVGKMTLAEKVGQLNLIIGETFNTGPTVRSVETDRFDEEIRAGRIGGFFNIAGSKYINRLQRVAVEGSRLGIPLMMGADVIHGYKTVFPLALGEAASWDVAAIEESARMAALEASSAGINWFFAPMVDITRDARWGRISEGGGEDPYLGSMIARARVKGFQQGDLSSPNSVAACAKHFVAYGFAQAGRDYFTVDVSEQTLWETILPPFQAAIDQGVASVMTSFNELNGVPVTGSAYLLRDLLRGQMKFEGLVVSDWTSVDEMIVHGYATDSVDATVKAITAGTDMDMMSYAYVRRLEALVESGVVEIATVDESVRNVLILKKKLGLFESPYQYGNPEKEEKTVRSAPFLNFAREMGRKSIVLLKNEADVLPLDKQNVRIGLVGPYAEDKENQNGSWSFFGEVQHPVSIREGLEAALGSESQMLLAKGCDFFDPGRDEFDDALQVARNSDVVVMALGEAMVMNGEGASRADIRLPDPQEALIEHLKAAGKPIVVLVHSGRPLDLTYLHEHVDAIVQVWNLGSMAGSAIADVLLGDYNPSGKLPVTFPRNIGQVPIFYYHKNTGRPYEGNYDDPKSERVYISKYRDVRNTPLYPFGFGLSYTTFDYSNLKLASTILRKDKSIQASVEVRNTGSREGKETVQWYIRDLKGSITRPVRELKGFEQVTLQPGESRTVSLTIDTATISYYQEPGRKAPEDGEFEIFAGGDSSADLMNSFEFRSAD